MKGAELRRRLLAATPEVRTKLVTSLPREESTFFESDFETFNHDGQSPPEGDWRTWLIMAGRGFGKTRAGAEWVLSLVRGQTFNPPRNGEVAVRSADGGGPKSGASSAAGPLHHAALRRGPPPRVGEDLGKLHIALVAATVEEARSVMVEGPSGLLALARPGEIAEWSPSLRSLRFANGALATLYSGARGESLRGPEHHFAWCDELAKWAQAENAWNNLQLGLRAGANPRALVTTTPRASVLLERIREAPDTVETGGATTANPHLPPAFVTAVKRQYGGTRLGRQEVEGILLTDVEGSLWPVDLIERCRISPLPFRGGECGSWLCPGDRSAALGGGCPSDVAVADNPHPSAASRLLPSPEEEGLKPVRTVIGVDPPASANGTCGIVVCAVDAGGTAYVIADCSVSGASPETWARAVADAAARFDADRVVAEKNQGGAMVRSVLLAASATLPLELVHAAVGKVARAEPVAALFENGRAFFAGHFAELEAQLGGMVAGGEYEGAGRSPDRADAMVWALWALMLKPQRQPPRISVL